jgi:hypothetical protein
MSRIVNRLLAVAVLAALAMQPSLLRAADSVGIFEDHGDVGVNPRKGSVEFDAAASTYKITGARRQYVGRRRCLSLRLEENLR